MNSLDLFLFIPIAVGFVFGLFKGLIKELTSLAAIVLGIYGAKLLAPFVSGILMGSFDISSTTAKPIAYFLLFVSIAIVLLLGAKMLDKFFESISLGGLNKLMGGFFGALKYALILSVLLNIFNALDSLVSVINTEKKESSICYKPLLKLGPVLWYEAKKYNSPENNTLKKDEKSEDHSN